eukprot:jgi/Bigna1/79934/fgenesh1_pg.66_\
MILALWHGCISGMIELPSIAATRVGFKHSSSPFMRNQMSVGRVQTRIRTLRQWGQLTRVLDMKGGYRNIREASTVSDPPPQAGMDPLLNLLEQDSGLVIACGSSRCKKQMYQLKDLFSGNRSTEPKVAYIPTAWTFLSDKTSTKSDGRRLARKRSAGRKKGEELQETLGMSVECIHLESETPETLPARLQGTNIIYVDGGNTFRLLHHMRRSGFIEICRRLCFEQRCVYVGISAGAIVAGADISTAFWKGWDDPTIVDQDWSQPSALEGLRLLPNHHFFPHYNETTHKELVAHRRKELAPTNELILLPDGNTSTHIL